MKKLIFAIAAVAASAAMAEVSFSYQGALKTATGENIPPEQCNKTISFRLYDTPTGEDALWGRMVAVHLDDNGLFNVELSDTAGSGISDVKTNDLSWVLSQYAGQDKTLYIGLDVLGSTGEIRPRQKLLNVPSAAFAADVTRAKNDFAVDGNATFHGIATFSGNITAQNGLTVNKGGLTVSSGELKAQNGLNVSGGTLTIGAGISINPVGDTAKGIIPHGVIVMWSGTADKIPQGWALCDGGNGTPDLRGRFIVGASQGVGQYGAGADQAYTPGNTGGESSHTLVADELPKHTHDIKNLQTHVIRTYAQSSHNPKNQYIYSETGYERSEYGDDFVHEITWTAGDNATSEKAHENRPPYYALCFIMKL